MRIRNNGGEVNKQANNNNIFKLLLVAIIGRIFIIDSTALIDVAKK